ncbi:MAG: PDZ domain-containing protein [Nitrospirae bacterium]|nr:MAG: PDZ domain-containing protein [Nitrospirota bacterium]
MRQQKSVEISLGQKRTDAFPRKTVSAFVCCLILIWCVASSGSIYAEPVYDQITKEEALRLGEEFGVIVGEVDEEIQNLLGLPRPEGVVVFEVIGGKPAELAGIKPRALIKEINSVDIANLEDFGRVLKAALATDNFTVATYEPPDPDNQGLSGGIQFHFVRREEP